MATKGKPLSEAHKKALSISAKKRVARSKKGLFKKGHSQSNTGKTHFKKGQTAWNKGKKCEHLRGENHPNWKGGTKSRPSDRVEYKEWTNSVLERDKHTCQECGETEGVIAHHIKSYAYYPELRFDIDNGLTLCEPCHSKTDNYKGRAVAIGRV